MKRRAFASLAAICFAGFAVSAFPGATQAAYASPPPAAAKKPEIDPQAKRITGSETYMPTFGLRASIARGFQVHGVLAVDAGLDIPDAKVRKRADGVQPRIFASMREAVSNYATLSYIIGERPDADMLRNRLQKAVDSVLGPGQAKVTLASLMVFAN